MNDELLYLISTSPSICVEELVGNFEVRNQTIRNNLHSLNYSPELVKWVPHQLSSFSKLNRVNVCKNLLDYHRRFNFLSFLVTCDEN
jgi:hypothetical protein